MQEATSSLLTALLDGGTDLMDVCKIQGLIWYFEKFRDEIGRFVKIQGLFWGISKKKKSFWSLRVRSHDNTFIEILKKFMIVVKINFKTDSRR